MQFGRRGPPHPSPLPEERERLSTARENSPNRSTWLRCQIVLPLSWREGRGEGEGGAQLHRYGLGDKGAGSWSGKVCGKDWKISRARTSRMRLNRRGRRTSPGSNVQGRIWHYHQNGDDV